jgi:hypothetical protein
MHQAGALNRKVRPDDVRPFNHRGCPEVSLYLRLAGEKSFLDLSGFYFMEI